MQPEPPIRGEEGQSQAQDGAMDSKDWTESGLEERGRRTFVFLRLRRSALVNKAAVFRALTRSERGVFTLSFTIDSDSESSGSHPRVGAIHSSGTQFSAG